MSEVSRRLIRVLAATTLLVVCPALIVSIPAGSDDNCTALRRFAEAYVGTSPTLDHIAAMDRSRRVAIVSVLSPHIRAALWRTHLGRFSQRADLSAFQRALVLEGITLLSPELFERKPQALRAWKEFWPRAEQAFTTRETRGPWYDLAAGETVRTKALANGTTLERIAQPFTANAQWLPGCNCADSMECGYAEYCQAVACQWFRGCGPIGEDYCTGRCSP